MNKAINPHPFFLDQLFAHQGQVTAVFRDILGLYDIHHIALSYANPHGQLLALSSTPSLEYNLFNKGLWRFDQTYQSSWYQRCLSSSWGTLYTAQTYDELYYIKQVKHDLPIGLSFSVKVDSGYVIYSMASHTNTEETAAIFASEHQSFYNIGKYCGNLLLPILM